MTVSTMPESFSANDALPMEFLMLPEVHDRPIDETRPQYAHVHVSNGNINRGVNILIWGLYFAKWRDMYNCGNRRTSNQHPLRHEAAF